MFIESPPSSDQCLRPEDTFFFRCAPDLACFGKCCRNKHLPLTPYDVLRLKTAVSMSSDAFLDRYALYSLDPVSGFPVLSLRLEEDEDRTCPFLSRKGCAVYVDRPTACRLFPLSRASRPSPAGASCDAIFSRVSLSYCLGNQDGRKWTVASWIEDQGLGPYVDFNDRMLDLVFHPLAPRGMPLHERQIQRILVACYNLDVFREFLTSAPIFNVLRIPQKTRHAILEDDARLLAFGHDFLEKTLFSPSADSSRRKGSTSLEP